MSKQIQADKKYLKSIVKNSCYSLIGFGLLVFCSIAVHEVKYGKSKYACSTPFGRQPYCDVNNGKLQPWSMFLLVLSFIMAFGMLFNAIGFFIYDSDKYHSETIEIQEELQHQENKKKNEKQQQARNQNNQNQEIQIAQNPITRTIYPKTERQSTSNSTIDLELNK